MKICYLGDASSIHVLRWIKYFLELGHEIHLISFSDLNVSAMNNIHYHKLDRLPRPFNKIPYQYACIIYSLSVQKILKKIKPDLIHAHYTADYGILSSLSGFKPLIITAWGSDILVVPKTSKVYRSIICHALKKANLITCDAHHLADAMMEMGISSEHIKIINFGVDIKLFKAAEMDQMILKKYHLTNEYIVISLRSLEPIYNVESLLKAVPFVLDSVPNCKFMIAGTGSEERFLKALAISLGVTDSVLFVGYLQQNELPNYLNSSCIYVSTSLSDGGIAASTAEAMACGLPVVVTDFGDNIIWVKDDVNGFVIPSKNPRLLAEKIIFLLKNDSLRQSIALNNIKKIAKENSYYAEMDKVLKIYEQLAKED